MYLKKLEIFDDQPAFLKYIEFFPDEEKLKYKIMYWSIKEIYYSPQRIFLNQLTKEQFYLRYFKAKKYMDWENSSIYEFLAYFIRSIIEEMEKGADINDRKNV